MMTTIELAHLELAHLELSHHGASPLASARFVPARARRHGQAADRVTEQARVSHGVSTYTKVGNGLGKRCMAWRARHTAFRAHVAGCNPTRKQALCSTSVGMGDEAGLQAGHVTHTRRCALREPCVLVRVLLP